VDTLGFDASTVGRAHDVSNVARPIIGQSNTVDIRIDFHHA